MYCVFQYYPAIRGLSLVRLLAFMKVVLVAGKLTTRNHARETPLLAGYLNTAVQKRERKTWGRTKFLINTVMFKWGWWFVILWAPVSNWIRNYIIQGLFNFISIASVSVERWVFVSQKLVGTHHAHNHIRSQRWLGLFYKNPVVFIFSRSLEETTENLICYFVFSSCKSSSKN